ncbi:hypothetical protein EV421DRAFT_1960944 [Armillaria borealis]|uniref:Uncharacterized protein n=1 Tax=Armillaria borealis TaxID=47425 RepID=A0AA39M5X8_9AGAR|nr:hypothetical protein EV421DRAFT_1960944 [Armillaria borealis]
MSGIDSCLKIAKLTAAAGEFAPFPFIKGAAQCVIVVLEVIESAAKNGKDLQELAESTVATLVVVRDTVITHGPTSVLCFKDICLDFQTYLNDLLSTLNKEGNPSRIQRLLKAKKISEDISAYRQQVQMAKDNFLIHTMTMTHITLSDVHGDVTVGFSTLTGSMETSERNITFIKDNIKEICTLGVQQNKNIENLLTRLLQASRQRGLYKGMVWDIIPGDIHDSYCTVENSSTLKIIREYKAHGNNGGDAMHLGPFPKSLVSADHLIFLRSYFMAQHESLFIIISSGLPATRFTQFFSVSFQDLQSISEVLPMENYRYPGPISFNVFVPDDIEGQVYVNKYGKLMFGDLLCSSAMICRGTDQPSYFTVKSADGSHLQVRGRGIYNIVMNLLPFVMYFMTNGIAWTQTFDRHRLQPPQYQPDDSVFSPRYQKALYAPGSIVCDLQHLLSPRRILVGRAQPSLHRWKWDISLRKEPSAREEVVNLSFDNGSVPIELSWDDVIKNSMISIHTCSEDSDEIVKSWIAQTSKLDSCLRFRDYGDDLKPYSIADVGFRMRILPKDDVDDFCHICNAKDRYRHALSLSITAPVIDYETNTIKFWPVVSCSRVCGMDSLKEEDIFTVKVRGYELQTQWGPLLKHMVRSTIPELNAEHGFDPARDGADVCEYFGWSLLEIRDSSTGEWTLNGTASWSSGPASVILDNTTLSQEHDSAPCGMDVTAGRIQEAQAEAPTKTEIVPIVQHDISTWALIIILIAISI